MRKAALIFSLVAVVLFASASDAFAQRRGGYRGGRGGGGAGVSIGIGGYYGGYYGWPNYSGRSNFYSSPSYYYRSAPVEYYADPVVQIPATEIRQSSYTDPNVATITVLVPNVDAEVWFDGSPTTQRGMERMFHSPGLQQGGFYTIRARWNENGRAMDQQRQVQVQPGQSVTVNFRGPPSEKLTAPRPPQN